MAAAPCPLVCLGWVITPATHVGPVSEANVLGMAKRLFRLRWTCLTPLMFDLCLVFPEVFDPLLVQVHVVVWIPMVLVLVPILLKSKPRKLFSMRITWNLAYYYEHVRFSSLSPIT